jgi:hypothetical protein
MYSSHSKGEAKNKLIKVCLGQVITKHQILLAKTESYLIKWEQIIDKILYLRMQGTCQDQVIMILLIKQLEKTR